MFLRKEYKKRAWQTLTNTYWMALFVCFIYSVVSGGLNFYYNYNQRSFHDKNIGNYFSPVFALFILSVFIFFFTLGMVFALFVTNPFRVGVANFFIINRERKSELDNILFAFKKGRYINIVGCFAWQTLIIFLWSLLLFIPGIIKSYAYCLVPYILSDNPNINYKEALRLSNEMTKGYKSEIFLLQLSFIGWYLLGLLCCCIGVIFVTPYYKQTFAEMYISLRNNAIHYGMIHPNELNLPLQDIYTGQQM